MTTIEDVRALASQLPRSYEALVRDRVRFRVGRLVYLAFSRDETVMGFAFPKEERDALVAAARADAALGAPRPPPSPRLLRPPSPQLAGGVEGGTELLDGRPQVVDAGALQRGDEHDARRPGLGLRAHEPERAAVVGRGGLRRGSQLAVVLVDDDDVGELDDPALDALQLVARARRDQDGEQVDHAGDCDLGLADTHRLDHHHVEAGGLAEQHRLARPAGDAAQGARGTRPAHG